MPSNADKLRTMFDRFWKEGDVDAWRGVFAPDSEWHGMDEAGLSGAGVGPRNVAEFFRDSLKMNPNIIEEMHHIPKSIAFLPTVMMAVGFVVSWLFYIRRPYLPVELANQHQMLYQFLLNKWYFDELYEFIFVRPAKRIGYFLWKKGDGYVIDGFGPDGVSARVLDITRNVVKIQTGYLYHYAFAMLIGVAGLITWFMFGLGGQ